MFIGQIDVLGAPVVPSVAEGAVVAVQRGPSPIDPKGDDLFSRSVRAGPPGWVRWLAALVGIAASTRALLRAR